MAKAGRQALKTLFSGLNQEGGLDRDGIKKLSEEEGLLFLRSNDEDHTTVTPAILIVQKYEELEEIAKGGNGNYALTEQGKKHLEWLEQQCQPRGRRL